MQKDISIIIPIFKDAATIGNTIDAVLHFFDRENLDGELVIVNDGGEDEAESIVQEKIKNTDKIHFINRKENKGKGFSVREGIAVSSGNIIFYTDADLPYGTAYIKQMYKKLSNQEYDFILANRNLSIGDEIKKVPLARKITHLIFSIFVGALVVKFSDTQAGLKGMTRKVAEIVVPHLIIDRFAFDVEFILLAKKNGFKIGELPVVLQGSGKSNLKIIFDSPQMIKDVLKIAWKNRSGFYNNKVSKL